jgi:hypothetical protein
MQNLTETAVQVFSTQISHRNVDDLQTVVCSSRSRSPRYKAGD